MGLENKCNLAFGMVKRLMASETVLAHFNPRLPITLSCDTNSYGLVLSNKYSDGSEDAQLSKVFLYMQSGRSAVVRVDLKPFFIGRHELCLEQGCIIWGMRVVSASKHRLSILL